MKKIVEHYVIFSEKRNWIVLSIFLILFALEVFFVSEKFVLNTDLKALFKGENKTVKELLEVEKRVGSFQKVLIASKSDSLEKNVAFLTRLKKKIEQSDLIDSVDFEQDISYLEKHGLLFLPIDELKNYHDKVRNVIRKKVQKQLSLDEEDENKKQEESQSSLTGYLNDVQKEIERRKKNYNISRYFSVNDGRIVVIKVAPSGNSLSITATKKITEFLEKSVQELNPEDAGVEVEVGGRYRHKLQEVKTIQMDLMSTLLLCVILLSITIVYYYRSLLSLFVLLLPLSAGIITALTFTILIIKEFNIISAFSFVVLYGLGIDFGIHLLSRYSEEKERTGNMILAMNGTLRAVVPAISSGAITTAAAFLTLFFLDFKGFSDYGLVAVTGILASLVSFILFFPVFIFSLEKLIGLNIRPRNITLLTRLYTVFVDHRKKVMATTLLFLVAAVISLFNIPFQYNLSKLSFPKSSAQNDSILKQYSCAAAKNRQDEVSRGLTSIVLTDSIKETEEVTSLLRDIQKKDPKRKILKNFLSIYSFIPESQPEKLRIIKRMHRLIERKKNLFPGKDLDLYEKDIKPFLSVNSIIELEKLPEWIKSRLTDKNGNVGQYVVTLLAGNKNDIRHVMELKNQIGTLHGKKKSYKIVGSFFLLADIYKVLHTEVPQSIMLALCAVFITLLITFRSIKHSIILIIPLLSGFVWMFAVSRLFSVEFNLFNMVIVPTILGIGIDSCIHIYHRFIHSQSIDEMPHILSHTGGAILFSSLTTLVGFASLMFSSHRGMQSIGAIASIGIVMMTVANLIIFPVIIRTMIDVTQSIRGRKAIAINEKEVVQED